MAVVIGIVAAIGVTMAFLSRSAEIPLLPEGTPEGTVHRFLLAVERGETRRAYAYLDSQLQEICTYQHFRQFVRWFEAKSDRHPDDLRVTLEETRPDNGAVQVRVRIIRFHASPPSPPSPFSPPFDGGESLQGERFTLEMIDGEWQFIDPPWPMRWCPEAENKPSSGGRPLPPPG